MASEAQIFASTPVSTDGYVESMNPATGEVMARIPVTPTETLPEMLKRARDAQESWASRPLRERCKLLLDLRDPIFRARNEIVDIVTRESGKPRGEVIFAEVLLALDTADSLARRAPVWLRGERVPHHNIARKAKSAWLTYVRAERERLDARFAPWPGNRCAAGAPSR